MGLAAPWALALAVLAVLPVVAHLVRRRDVPEVPLPTVALLERARVRSRRRARLVDLALLALRVLVVLACAVAVAAPYTLVPLAWGDGTRASVAIVIDDSLSMARRDGEVTLLATARSRAASIVASLPEGSEACVVMGGAPPRVVSARSTDLGAARRALEALDVDTPTRGTALPAAVRSALRELSGATNDARRVVVLTDGARHAHADALPDGGDTSVEVVRVPPPDGADARDVAVAEVAVVPDPTQPGRAQVLVSLRASGGASAAQRDVRLEDADGHVLVHGPAGPMRDGVARVSFSGARLAVDGDDPRARVVVAAGGDALAADDARGVLLRASTGVRVLVVAATARAATPVVRALDLAPDAPIARATIDPGALAAHDLGAVDVVLLLAPPELDDAGAAALSRFVARGGGLGVVGGDGTDDATLRTRLGSLLPCATTGTTVPPAPLGLRSGDGDRDGDRDLGDATGLLGAHSTTRLALDAPPPGARVPLRFDDGAPALVLADRGRGRLALFATSLDESWSDLPLRPGFLPLVVRLVRALAGDAAASSDAVAPGTRVALSAPPGSSELVVVTPGGGRHGVHGATFDDTLALGAYRVLATDDAGHVRDATRLAFVVAPPPDELDLEPGPAPERVSAARHDRASAGVVRRPLSPWAWLLVALLVVAEGVVRLRFSARR